MQNAKTQELTQDDRKLLNRVAREEMKLKLLADIRTDLMICEIEGWNKREYIEELKTMMDEIVTQCTGTKI